MQFSLPQKRIVRFGVPLILVIAVAAALVVTLSPKTEATPSAGPSMFTEIVESLKVDAATKSELEAAIAALVERNGQAQALLDSTAGKVLDDSVRSALQTDITTASDLVTGDFPKWQTGAVALLALIANANSAYDASAPAVTANHEQWVIATTPPPPPVVSNGGGGSKSPSSNSGGGGSKKPSGNGNGNGGSNSNGGGGSSGSPSGGGWTDNGGGNGVWEQPVGPGTSFE